MTDFGDQSDNWPAWLDPRTNAEDAKHLMAPPPTGSLDMYVTTAVNDVKNNGPRLDPLPEG